MKRPIRPLTDDDIRAIRALRGKYTQAKLGQLYDRSQCVIAEIQLGRTYRYVPDMPVVTAPPAPFDLDDWLARHVKPQPLED